MYGGSRRLHFFDSIHVATSIHRAHSGPKRVAEHNREALYNTSYILYHVSNTSLVKTRRIGGSLVVTLPKQLTESKGIKEGEIIEITVNKLRVDGFGALRGIGPFTAEDELKAHE